VKKVGALKIIHDKFRAKKTAEEFERFKRSFAGAVEAQKDLGMYVNRAVHEDLNPLKVLDLFRRMSDEVCISVIVRWLITDRRSRIASCWDCGLRTGDPKSSYGSTYLYHR
jgi:IS30 family transposase